MIKSTCISIIGYKALPAILSKQMFTKSIFACYFYKQSISFKELYLCLTRFFPVLLNTHLVLKIIGFIRADLV